MQVTILAPSADLYGSDRILLQDVEGLLALGAGVRVVIASDSVRSQDQIAALRGLGATVTVEELRVLRRARGARSLRLPLRLPEAARQSELVILWTLAMSAYLPALRAARVPTLVSVHEILGGLSGRALARLVRLANHAMANSEATRRWLQASGGLSRDGVTMAYYVAPRRAATTPPPADVFTVLLAGRIHPWKGQPEAIRAVRRLRAAGTPIRLHLAGGCYPGNEALLERLLDEVAGDDGIVYLGELPGIRPALEDVTALLVASQRPEPFGFVALEAWAAGRRAIVPAEGGALEAASLVEGVTFAPRSEADMARQLGRVAADPGLAGSPSADAPVARLCTMGNRMARLERALERALPATTASRTT